MRQINEDRRRRTFLLSKRLEEFAVVRRYLVDQLEELDAKARDVQIEVNWLQNLDAPISTLPDEMLAMVFEAGSLLPQKPQVHFGSLVSHVSQHWRKIAMATPRLWNKIYCDQPEGMDYDASYYEYVQRNAAFLERSQLFPVEIYISSLMANEHYSQNFIEHIRDHIGQCSRLSITAPDSLWLSRALGYLLCQPAPLLSSIELAFQDNCDEPSSSMGSYHFPCLAPYA
ncbi:hypothetical protein FIBSPDRAFT_964376 [Athelia psychrophila]|uniref:Uncharacterized protein n=1 Tax=Athelia psychrophila TaxID=1759441 RepID=A0A165XVD4_9AGAM|nr:hypothetical protein FIBSPDRAFT_964376 [Fibularhizoctonia sp. CBS 109695]